MHIPNDLYDEICRSMPISCVDILVTNTFNQVLLVKRNNEPMKNEWWFPGGRVLFNEKRSQAAIRKLNEECGLKANKVTDLGTFDMILPMKNNPEPSHAITTLFHAEVDDMTLFKLDSQSQDAQWRIPEEWLKIPLHVFIEQALLKIKEIA